MAERVQKTAQKSKTEELEVDDLPEKVETTDVDDLLDEIDAALEENAEEFIKAYVQKGGQ